MVDRLLNMALIGGEPILYVLIALSLLSVAVVVERFIFYARNRIDVPLHVGDMCDFDLGKTFDVITNNFSSIGYAQTKERLRSAIECVDRHLNPGGVALIEPWFTREKYVPGHIHMTTVDKPDLKIARVSTSFREGRLSYFDLHYLVGTPEGTEHFVERHELGLFETDEMRAVLEEAGLSVIHDAEGLIGRGLFIGQKPG